MRVGLNLRYVFLASTLLVLSLPSDAQAYIGPGAGFAFLGSTFVFVLTFFLGLATFLLWPLRLAWRKIRGYGIPKTAKTRRVVIVGLDGLEPTLLEKYMGEGRLPNLKALKEEGGYSRLKTTTPALSPVAWSTFQTGVNPGSHNIFDFLTRDKRTCLPELTSTESIPGKFWVTLGKFKFFQRAGGIRITRRSQPFWRILGKYGIFSNIIRVPISYPPEKFFGNILSAMCTPDMRGSQGTFTYYSASDASSQGAVTGGERHSLARDGNKLSSELVGPPNPTGSGSLKVPFSIVVNGEALTLHVADTVTPLVVNQFSPWIKIVFKAGRAKVSGICRFCVRKGPPDLELYVSPINIDPEKPALPISQPAIFSSWVAKKIGSFGTLGLMEDTWGRNELALDDQRFLDQTYLTHAEREQMFFQVLERTKEGLCACVFDASDRIQHMFWRYMDSNHPSPLEEDKFKNTIPEMYQRMDELVGKVRAKINPGDVFFVLSDHGFTSFRRGVNINTWLMKEGYLTLKDGKTQGADYLQDVDWTKTRAFGIGLSGLYLNIKGRERRGIVPEEQAKQLKAEITAKLKKLIDPQSNTAAVLNVYDSGEVYRGLYAEDAPDLIVGYNHGYRVSWESVTGELTADLFSDNLKAWSGDHHIDPELIPGICLCNKPITKSAPHIADFAPTVLDLFAVKIPGYMEGKPLV